MGYEIEPSVEIHSSPEFIWEQLIDIESWWVASNDEHISLNIESNDKQLKTGTEITVRERIAGIPCCAEGAVTEIKTNRLVVIDESWPLAGVSSEVAYGIQKYAFDYLDAPVTRVNSADTSTPYAPTLVDAWLPDKAKILKAAKEVLYMKA